MVSIAINPGPATTGFSSVQTTKDGYEYSPELGKALAKCRSSALENLEGKQREMRVKDFLDGSRQTAATSIANAFLSFIRLVR